MERRAGVAEAGAVGGRGRTVGGRVNVRSLSTSSLPTEYSNTREVRDAEKHGGNSRKSRSS